MPLNLSLKRATQAADYTKIMEGLHYFIDETI